MRTRWCSANLNFVHCDEMPFGLKKAGENYFSNGFNVMSLYLGTLKHTWGTLVL